MEAGLNFQFDGKIASNKNTEEVKANLAKLFSVKTAAWDAIFSGESIFLRENIDRYTAQKYFEHFKHAGAIGKIVKYSAKAPEPELQSNNIDIDEIGLKQDRQFKIFLRIGASILFVLIFLDDFLQFQRIEISTWMYVIPALFLAIGALYYAEKKGYPKPLGLVMGASIVGLPFLLLLPDKNSNAKRSSFEWLILLIFCATFAIYGLNSIESVQTVVELENKSKRIRNQFKTYPDAQLVSESDFKDKRDLIEAHIKDGIKYLEKDLRVGQNKYVVHTLHEDLARYSMWVNYQKLLYLRKYDKVAKYLKFGKIDRQQYKLINIIKPGFIQHKNPMPNYFATAHIDKMLSSLKFAGVNVSRSSNRDYPLHPLSEKYWNKPKFRAVESVTHIGEGIIEIKLKKSLNDSYAGKTVLIAFASFPNDRRPRYSSSGPSRIYRSFRIGGDLEDFYILNNYSQLNRIYIPGN